MKGSLTLALLTLALAHSALAHVRLTFPPARDLDLDFLDNVRTKPPCGMPKGKAEFFRKKLSLKPKLRHFFARVNDFFQA